jgi:hypothetical protein
MISEHCLLIALGYVYITKYGTTIHKHRSTKGKIIYAYAVN